MSDWLHNLPVPWMALVVFGFTYLLAALIYVVIARLAAVGLGKTFKSVSVGMLPVLGIIFGLFVAFTAAQVWGDSDRRRHLGAADRRARPAVYGQDIRLAGAAAPDHAGGTSATNVTATSWHWLSNKLFALRIRHANTDANEIAPAPVSDRSVAVSRTDPDVIAVRTLHVAALLIGVVAGAAAVAFGRDCSTRARTDDGANGGSATTAERATQNSSTDAADDGTADGVLCRGLMDRHRHGDAQACCNSKTSSKTSKHPKPSLTMA
jgi:hypothetical protein